MVTRVKNHSGHTSHYVFHRGLVKLLIMTELKKLHRSWQHFLFWYGFEPQTLEAKNDNKMHIDGKETERKPIGSRGQKRKVEQGNNKQEDEFNVDNEPISEILQTEVQKKYDL